LGPGVAEAKFAFSATADPDDTEAGDPGSEESCLLNPESGEEPFCTPGDQITLGDDFATPGDFSDDLPAQCGSGVTCNTADWTAIAPNTATFTYSREFFCAADQVDDQFIFENTAFINELGRTSSAKVTVDCLKFGSKAGYKFEDMNADGIWQLGADGLPNTSDEGEEPTLANWDITLTGTDDKGTVGPTTIATDANGFYKFENLRPGTYTVAETLKTDWTCSYPNPGTPDARGVVTSTDCTHDFTVTSEGEDHEDNNFGNWSTTTKAGTKYEDLDADGSISGDPVLADWTIFVDYNDNGDLDTGEPSDVTAADGTYLIEGIVPGDFKVREVLKDGWFCSYPNPGTPDAMGLVTSTDCSYAESFRSRVPETGNDFGNWSTTTKAGTKYEDLNADGDISGDPVLADWTIFVDYNDNGDLDSGEPFDVTAADGTYLIEGIVPGSFKVREVLKTDWTCSYPNPGTPDAMGLVTSTDCTYSENFQSRVPETGNDFGNWTTATKAGTKYLDNDGDGGFDSPLSGYTIYVDYNDNGSHDAATEPYDVTGADGTYLIEGIVPGTWKVREIQLNSMWVCTFPTNSDFLGDCYHQDTFDSSEDETGNNFANYPPEPETAWAANARTPLQLPFNPDGGNWATYVDSDGRFPDRFCTNLYESQTNLAGEVCFEITNGDVRIEITLTGGYIFQPGGVIKVQDYATSPEGTSSAPGQFDFNGVVDSSTFGYADVPLNRFYAVHTLVIDMGN
jgi:hypothetical protein